MRHILYIQRLPQHSSDSAVTGPVGIHYSVSDSTPKQGGQSDHTIRRATSNMTQIDRLAPVTRTQFIDSKQATPTAFDLCMLTSVPTMDFRDTTDP
jgi:hypothetical protein